MAEQTISSLEDQVKKLISENDTIQKAIQQNPKLKDALYGNFMKAYQKYSGILKGGELVDKVDRILGPLEAALRWFGPGAGYLASFSLRAVEEVFFKIPYAVYYTSKIGDYKALPGWIASETAATLLPYGDIIDILPIYKNRAAKYLRNDVAANFVDYLHKEFKPEDMKALKIPLKEQDKLDTIIKDKDKTKRKAA